MGEADSFEEVSGDLSSILGRQRSLPDWVYDGAILAVQEGSEAVDRKIDAAISARQLVQSAVEAGFEPHFAVVYGDAADALEILGHMLDIEVVRYR